MHSRSDVFAENIVQALTSGEQPSYLEFYWQTPIYICKINVIDFANHKQL